MKNNSIQEYLAQKELDERNIVKKDSDSEKSNNILNNEISKSNGKYASRDVCNGVPNWREITVAALYRPIMNYFPPAVIGYFISSDDWDKQALFTLKEKISADFLVAIQTDDQDNLFDHLDIIKCVIKCQLNEVDDVIKLLDVYSPRYGLLCLNAYDIKDLFKCSKSFKYIQVSANGTSKADSMEKATQNVVNQLLEIDDIKAILVNSESNKTITLDEMNYLSKSIESIPPFDNAKEPYYSYSTCDELNCFKVRALYAEA